MEKIFLNKYRSKLSSNQKNTLGVLFKNSKRLLPQDEITSTINLGVLYNEERFSCEKVRLNCVIRPYCTNVLYNANTEITQNEGSDDAVCVNFIDDLNDAQDIEPIYKEVESYGSSSHEIVFNLIDDTQLSSVKRGNLEYHCGLDFFNNHILRSKTFKSVNPINVNGITDSNYNNFNTLHDFHRHYDGTVVSGDTTTVENRDFSKNSVELNNGTSLQVPYANHLYTYDDLMLFTDCVLEKIEENNGWLGFINKGKIKIFDTVNEENEYLDISKPLNNRESCEFVDLYPTRELFSFAPKYNPHRHRIEKNWNYCITYPSSSTTSGIPFINDEIDGGALRLFLVNETFDSKMRMHSMVKHGLEENDYIRLYKGNEMIISNLQVIDIIDEYTFDVSKNGYSIGSKMEVSFSNSPVLKPNTTYKFAVGGKRFYDSNSDFMSFSFKRLKNGRGVNCYVRIFSKLPNWKFADKKITEKLIYEDEPEIVETYQKVPFDNHVAKLSFSKTIFNDDVSEIIFTDDIDISKLHDNLGRPISSVYLTIVKSNKGYKEWYEDKTPNDEKVEYSHCFGRVCGGFMLSKDMYDENYIEDEVVGLSNTRVLCESGRTEQNIMPFSGLDMTLINDVPLADGDIEDTVNIENDNNFYGDLCEYCKEDCIERVLQEIDYRFNTYQRENIDNIRLRYCNISKDDYDTNEMSSNSEFMTWQDVYIGHQYEGYYYHPHYRIDIRPISTVLSAQKPKVFTIRRIINNAGVFTIFTNENNYLQKGDKFLLYMKEESGFADENIAIKFIATDIIGFRELKCKLVDTNDSSSVAMTNFSNENKVFYRIIKPDVTIPNYAEFLTNGSCQYVWREVLPNGYDESAENEIERYPFTNGRLYVMKDFDFFLHRQNPEYNTILTNHNLDSFRDDRIVVKENNKYYEEREIKC